MPLQASSLLAPMSVASNTSGMARRLGSALLASVLALVWAGSVAGQEQSTVELRNGALIGPGVLTLTDTVSRNSAKKGSNADAGPLTIYVMDNGLTATHFNSNPRTVFATPDYNGAAEEEFHFENAKSVVKSGKPPAINGFYSISAFDVYGRRTIGLNTSRGRLQALQGITILTPSYVKLETLRLGKENTFAFDQRMSPNAIPAAELRKILYEVIDLSEASEWLRVVNFYLAMERFGEAKEVMEEALRLFPVELKPQRTLLTGIDQQYAQLMFDEIRLRREAGQVAFAATYLQKFPVATLPLETQIELQREVESLKAELGVVQNVVEAVRKCFSGLTAEQQSTVKPVFDELLAEVNLSTIARMADFQVLRRDASIPNENLASYIIGGWLLGQGAGIDNFAVAQSLVSVREIVREYLDDANAARRSALLLKLNSEESARPEFLAKLLATMKPPQTAPEVQGDDPPGLFRLEATADDGTAVPYMVQLPPEYDPNQKYPCVLTMGGVGDSLESEIAWWCGVPIGGVRHGHASRHGYIVVTPLWADRGQAKYNYTESEKDRILSCLRDAMRKFSIDTVRLFAAGHHAGATAAWDLAVSHPGMWAGLVAISPAAGKYIQHYSPNVAGIRIPGRGFGPKPFGTYIVWGQYDSTLNDPKNKVSDVVDEYLTSAKYDCILVEYRGNGRMRFGAELPNIFEWMGNAGRRRGRTPGVKTPREILARTMRSGDRFFYWLEAVRLLPTVVSNPYLFDPKAKGTFEAKILEPGKNAITISGIPAQNRGQGVGIIVWLTPDMVDFKLPIDLRIKGKLHRQVLQPDIGVMLEDARQRGDRAHVFWQRVVIR